MFLDSRKQVSVVEDVALKLLANEFRHYECLANTIFEILRLKESSFALRVPLTALLEYRGFVALASAWCEQRDV
jgi:hypothetical protein